MAGDASEPSPARFFFPTVYQVYGKNRLRGAGNQNILSTDFRIWFNMLCRGT